MRSKKKTPSDYPQFYCRMKAKDKADIERLIFRIHKLKMKSVNENEILPKRNEYITEALKIGLKELLEKVKDG